MYECKSPPSLLKTKTIKSSGLWLIQQLLKSLPVQCKILFCEDVLNFVPKVPEKLNSSLKEELLNQTEQQDAFLPPHMLYPQILRTQHKNILQMLLSMTSKRNAKNQMLKD